MPSLTIDAGRGARRRRGRLGDVGELAQAGEWLAAGGDASLAGGAGLVERLVHEAGLDRGDDAARGLDALQFAPRLGRQLVGEVLDVPRAAGRVDDAGQVALQLQHGLGVAGDPAAERGAACP